MMQFPWYRLRQQKIISHYGGYSELMKVTLAYLIAHVSAQPDDLWAALAPAATDLAHELRSLFDNVLFADLSDQLTNVDIVVSPLPTDPNSPAIKRILDLAPDERGRHILLDMASGSSLAAAADNNGISRQSAHERMTRLKTKARKELSDV